MARTLTAGVIVHHPGSGDPHFLPTGSALPDWAAGLVGDHVLSAPGNGETEKSEVASSDSGPPKPPRRSGPGSSAKAWRTYATEQGIGVEGDADRDTVIAALDTAGIPT